MWETFPFHLHFSNEQCKRNIFFYLLSFLLYFLLYVISWVDGIIPKCCVQFWHYDLFYQLRQMTFTWQKMSNLSIINSTQCSGLVIGIDWYNHVQFLQIVWASANNSYKFSLKWFPKSRTRYCGMNMLRIQTFS